jgi:hypothetical protein
MKKKKLSLDQLEVTSFITSEENPNTIKGGSLPQNVCVSGLPECGAICPDTRINGSCGTAIASISTSIIHGCCIDTRPDGTCPI